MDNDARQLKFAQDNFKYAKMEDAVQLIQGDARNICLPNQCVDKVVCDAPFGYIHIPVGDITEFYATTLKEISRILKPNGKFVLLTSQDISNKITTMFSEIQQKCDCDDNTKTSNYQEELQKCQNVNKHGQGEQLQSTEQEDMRWDQKTYSTPQDKYPSVSDSEVESAVEKTKSSENCEQEEGSHSKCAPTLHFLKVDKSHHKTDSLREKELFSNRTNDGIAGESNSFINSLKFVSKHYIKLGETHSYVCIFIK